MRIVYYCFSRIDYIVYLMLDALVAAYVLASRADRADARRAPLAERSAVNRQVLGSIPSAGVRSCGVAASRG